MNWCYVSGFFDGEGCAQFMNHNKSISFHQSGENGKQALERMRDFLRSEGIVGRMNKQENSGISKKCTMHRLKIASRRGIRKACEKMLPYLLVKKAAVQDILRFTLLYPQLTFGNVPVGPPTEKIIYLRWKGLTYKAIAQELGMKPSTVESRVTRYNMRGGRK